MRKPVFTFHAAQAPREPLWKAIYWGFLLALAILMCLLVPHYGSSGDELARHGYGQRVLEFLTGLHPNPAHPLPGEGYKQPYGPLFDGTAALLVQLFHPQDEYLLRHYWNAFFGFAGIALAGLCGRRITGSWRTALVASVLLVLTPRYFGDAFNNPKDIPFAATGLFFFYAFLRWLEELAAPRWKTTLLLGGAMMAAMSIRPGGFLFIVYFGLFSLLMLAVDERVRFRQLLPHALVAFVIGYFGCCLFWPNTWDNPLLNQILFFKSQSKLIMIGSVLFEGKLVPSPQLPWYYAFKMLFITMPILGMVGLAGSLLACRQWPDARRWKLLLLLVFVAIPLAGIIVRGSVFYDGVRHLLFLVVFLSLAAGVGVEYLLFQPFRQQWQRWAGWGLLALLALSPLRFMVRNHPFEYTYYNETVGGLKGAYGRYETDYYNYSVKQAYDWLITYEAAALAAAPDSLKLASGCYNQLYFNYTVAHPARLSLVDVNFFTQNCADWDYGIFISRYIDGPAIQNGYWPYAAKVIHEVKADGIPLCVVLKNDADRYGFKAWKAKEAGDYRTAIHDGLLAAARYPKDLELWSNLARSYLALNRLDSAQWASDRALAISGDNNVSVYYAGEIAFRQNDYRRAEQLYSTYLERYPHLAMSWLGLAQAQAAQGNIAAATTSFWKGFVINTGDQYRMYKVLALLAARRGMPAAAATFEAWAQQHFVP